MSQASTKTAAMSSPRVKPEIAKRTCQMYLKNHLDRTGQRFVHSPYYRKTFLQLVKYFNNEQDCEFDLRKGILLYGCVGSGKTTLMRIFKRFLMQFFNQIESGVEPTRIEIFSCIHIVQAIKEKNDSILNYCESKKPYVPCFDEIGKEEPINDFGTNRDLIEYALSMRYHRGIKTHGTTNLTMEDIKKRYGERLHSRFYDMFNVIEVSGIDFRKISQ